MCKFHARRRRSVPLLAAVLLVPVIMRADAPKFTGTWQMDEAKSQVADGRVVTLVLDASDTLVKITQTIKTKAGQESSTQFSVTMGKECDYNEGSHKSKLVAWYAGPSLNIVKSDGPPGDIANQWVLQLSPDQKTLTLTFSHVDPAAKDETLVFNRK